MKTHVEFRSKKFSPYEGEEEKINPGIWGQRLAEYLKEKLTANGVETKDIYYEDWGWAIPIKNDAFPAWIGCGHQYGDEDQYLCFIEPSKPMVRKLFKKIDTVEFVGRLAAVLDKILTSDLEIGDVRWRDESEK